MTIQTGPWKRENLVTNQLPVEKIPGLARSEDYSGEQLLQKVQEFVKPSYTLDDLYSTFAPLHGYVRCPVERAFEYFSNIHALEEWTATVRNLKHIGDGLYRGDEMLVPNTSIWFRMNVYPDAKCVDQLCAWDQGQELWMRYHFRFIDAWPTLRKPGTVISWLNIRHPYYNRDTPDLPQHIREGQSRTDRPMWVGDIFRLFVPAHQLELNNLTRILEARWGHEVKG